jgi:hypothetical protein
MNCLLRSAASACVVLLTGGVATVSATPIVITTYNDEISFKTAVAGHSVFVEEFKNQTTGIDVIPSTGALSSPITGYWDSTGPVAFTLRTGLVADGFFIVFDLFEGSQLALPVSLRLVDGSFVPVGPFQATGTSDGEGGLLFTASVPFTGVVFSFPPEQKLTTDIVGFTQSPAIPEPGTLTLLGLGLTIAARRSLRARHRGMD